MRPRASSQTLTDHEEIRRWAEQRDAWPASVRNTGRGREIGMIRLDFPGYSGAGSLEEISWDEWFQKFDDNNLALIVQHKTAGGEKSNFNKIVGRDTVEGRARSGRRTSRRARAGTTAGRRRTSARSPSARRAGGRRSAKKASRTRSSARARSKSGTSARGSRSGSRRGGARVMAISSGRSRRAQARTSSKRSSARSGQSRRRAA